MTHLRKSCWKSSSDVITQRLQHNAISAWWKDSRNTSTALPIASVRDIFGNTKPNSSPCKSCRPARSPTICAPYGFFTSRH